MHAESVRFPTVFPIRTVLPLRVMLAEPRVFMTLERAAWQQDQNIGDPKVLAKVLSDAGFDAKRLIEAANQPAIKAKLRENTEFAIECGVVGVPSYRIGEEVVWGQDRIHQVQDLCNGWEPIAVRTTLAKM